MSIRRTVLTAVVVAAALAVPAAASAVPTVTATLDVVEKPGRIAQGPDGNMWVLLDGAVNDVARISPAGVVTPFDVANLSGATGLTAGPDGNLWFTRTNQVGRFSPANPAAGATVFANATVGGVPQDITTGPDGNLWTPSVNKISKVDPATGAEIANFPLNPTSDARGITRGADGNLWVGDLAGAVIRVTPAGVATSFAAGKAGQGPQDVAASTGPQVGYSAPAAADTEIGRVTSAGQVLKTPRPDGGDPFGMTFGADGAYWIANFASGTLGRLTTDGQYSELKVSGNNDPRRVAAGPGNTLWVSLEQTLKVVRVSGVDPVVPAPGGGGGTPPPGTTPATPLPLPGDTTRPAVSRAKVSARRRTLTLTLSEPASLSVQISKRGKRRRYRVVRRLTRALPAGKSVVRLGRLSSGVYRVSAVATDAAGNAARRLRISVRA